MLTFPDVVPEREMTSYMEVGSSCGPRQVPFGGVKGFPLWLGRDHPTTTCLKNHLPATARAWVREVSDLTRLLWRCHMLGPFEQLLHLAAMRFPRCHGVLFFLYRAARLGVHVGKLLQ